MSDDLEAARAFYVDALGGEVAHEIDAEAAHVVAFSLPYATTGYTQASRSFCASPEPAHSFSLSPADEAALF